MIVVTGGAGFIGSALVWRLNQLGRDDILIVDELGFDDKWKNLVSLRFTDFINKNDFINEVESVSNYEIEAVFHMGASSSTTEKNADHLLNNNYEYTKKLAGYCYVNNIRFIYASSAATYGNGSKGFNDDESTCENLRPLNMYGYSKNLFDVWAKKRGMFDKIVGLKYFNVFGPNEYHKGDMRSVVHKSFEQIKETGKVRLFKSKNKNYKDGEQKRDFIYIKDAVEMTLFFFNRPEIGGLFNIGSGNARTWNDLAAAIFKALEEPLNIEYIDMPSNLEEKYQYFTEAGLQKIKKAGYTKELTSLEAGVTDYIKNYLVKGAHLGD